MYVCMYVCMSLVHVSQSSFTTGDQLNSDFDRDMRHDEAGRALGAEERVSAKWGREGLMTTCEGQILLDVGSHLIEGTCDFNSVDLLALAPCHTFA